jgi:dienelactone hydrolase
VFNHGATHVSNTDRGPRYRYTYSAYYFLSRGYAVALPMARGFAGSSGDLVTGGCALDRVGEANARDVRGVIEALRRRPDIDGSRIVVSGQSFGGWTTMALGTLDVPGVRGLIGFSPALRSSDCRAQDQAMIDGAGAFGANARLPSLWFYGDNDSVMPETTWRSVFDTYVRAGGHGTLASVGRFLQDSHQLLSFPEGIAVWVPWVDAFLGQIGLPSAVIHPEYLPLPWPLPTHAAALDDVSAVPFVSDQGRDAYRQFLTRKFPRVFAIAPNGTASVTDGGFDPLARALAACRKMGLTCRPYAIDNDVVWPAGAGSVMSYARTIAAGRTTTLDFASDINRDCSSRGRPKISVSQPPAHGTAEVIDTRRHPLFPADSPYATCNNADVDGVVVTYEPTPGFSGADTLIFEETTVEGAHRVFRMVLTIR